MYDIDPQNPLNSCDSDAESASNAYFTLVFLMAGLGLMTYAFARLTESQNRLDYESRFARMMAGFFVLMIRALHARGGDLEIANTGGKLIAIGPHRTGWEAAIVGSAMVGTPPQFLATDAYSGVPGVSSLMQTFKAIPVSAHATKGENGRSANANALELASEVLSKNGCVALFPQGNFAKLGQEPHAVYPGVARLALMNKTTILVVRLDNFWCLQNPLIPESIRNHNYYRAIFSFFHPNNVRVTLCTEIDVHLRPENQGLNDDEKIKEILAELYSFFRRTEDLAAKDVEKIQLEIANKTHLLIWDNKVKRDKLKKELRILEEEGVKLEETSSLACRT